MLSTVVAALTYVALAAQTSSYSGLHGRALKNAIAQSRPEKATSASHNINELIKIYGNECMLSGITVNSPVAEQLVPAQWIVTPAAYTKSINDDLFNQLIIDAKTSLTRNGLPIGEAASTVYRVYEPAAQYKGALARAMFYVATLYPADIWEGNGAVVFRDFSPYPTLSEEMSEIYLKWNREYPPTEAEKAVNDRIETLQGNRNIYVDYPELAEHIWGEKKNIPYGNSSSTPTTHVLKSRYFTNEIIYLAWPTADDNAVWTIDGSKVKSLEIPASELKPGEHEVTFKSQNRSGRIIINIKQR